MLPIKITRGASVQIQEAAGWWSANRPKAPGAFAEDLRRAFQLISLQPKIGTRAANNRLQGIRRIHLSCIRYYLYYRLRKERVEVLALWHSSREREPNL